MRNTVGSSEIMGIVEGIVGVAFLMTVMFGDWLHWIPIALAILMALKATKRLNK